MVTHEKISPDSEIFIRAIYSRCINLENKAISSPI